MRGARWLVAVALASTGCPRGDDGCEVDGDCAAGVCARTGECLAASSVRAARVTWTIRGMPASDALCARAPTFYLVFGGTEAADTHGYDPVPCNAGLFSIDKLPRRFVSVEIGAHGRFSELKALDAQGDVAFDLTP